MRILQVIDTLKTGGAERVFVDLANLLYQQQVEMAVLVFLNKGELRESLHPDIPRVDFVRRSKYNLVEWYRLSKLLNSYDILHVHMRHNYLYIRLICRIFNVEAKVILHDHSSIFESTGYALKTFLRPAYYIGVSRKLTSWAGKKLSVDSRYIYLLHNIVIKETFKPSKEVSDLVVVGNIKPEKNQLFVVQLLPYIDMGVTFIGNIHDKFYYRQLITETETLQLTDRVTFMHNVRQVQKELSNFKLGLMPSTRESGPLVLIEYLAQSLPFISFKTGEISDILVKEFPSFFISNFEAEVWVQKIKEVVNNKEYNLAKVYDTLFSPEKYIETCLNIYRKVINS